MKENLKTAKKELFIARRNCILACTKAAVIVTLAAIGPTSIVAGVGGAIAKKMKEQTKEVPYIEEVLVDSKGNEKVTEVKEDEKQESFYKVYTDCSPLDGQYVVSYELYTGDDITYENLDIVNSYEVPAYKVFEYQVSGIEKVDQPVDKGYSIARVYRVSDNTYERPIQKGDKEYTKMRVFDITKSILVGSTSYFCLRNAFFKEDSVYKKYKDKLEDNCYSLDIRNKKEKVKSLKRKSKEE